MSTVPSVARGLGLVDSRSSDRSSIVGSVVNSVLLDRKFNVCSMNIQSIRSGNKMDELRLIFNKSKASVIVITETWANTSVDDTFLKLEGYKFLRHDRLLRRGGGILVYATTALRWSLVEKSGRDCRTEFVLVEIDVQGQRLLLFVVYNPPGVDCLGLLEEKFSYFSSRYDDIVLVGDLNLDFLRHVGIQHLLLSSGVTNYARTATHFSSTTSTAIDYMASSRPERFLVFNQIDYSGFSRHDILFCSLDYEIQRQRRTVRKFRSFSRFDPFLLSSLMCSIDWDQFLMSTDTNFMASFFADRLAYVQDSVFPLRTRKSTVVPCPWYNGEIRSAMLERDMAYRHWRRSRSQESFSQFKRLRNKCRAIFRKFKDLYLRDFLRPGLTGKALWSRLELCGVKKAKNASSCEYSPDAMNDYFVGCVDSSTGQIPALPTVWFGDLSDFRVVSETDVLIFCKVSRCWVG
jgi:hypothetical protein